MAKAIKGANVLQAVLDNEPSGWRRLLERYVPVVRAVARLVFDSYREPAGDDDVDTVAVEVFERLAADRFQWLRSLRDASMLEPSIRALAAWRALGLLRARYRVFTCSLEAEARIGKHHVATAVLARPPSRERAPLLTREEVNRLVAKFLTGIGERPALILRALYEKGRSYEEVAEKESVPLPSVAQTVFEERRRFADRLAKAAPEAGL